jgi:hypothetical protein
MDTAMPELRLSHRSVFPSTLSTPPKVDVEIEALRAYERKPRLALCERSMQHFHNAYLPPLPH